MQNFSEGAPIQGGGCGECQHNIWPNFHENWTGLGLCLNITMSIRRCSLIYSSSAAAANSSPIIFGYFEIICCLNISLDANFFRFYVAFSEMLMDNRMALPLGYCISLLKYILLHPASPLIGMIADQKT